MKRASLGRTKSAAVLARLIDAPNLVQTVRGLPPATFAALVRHVGVEDAGELVALSTTPQLVAAFDRDLFVNEHAGEREAFNRARFVTWLEVLLEAGDAVAAARVVELSEDFVVHALSSLLLVLEDDALRDRIAEGGYDAEIADKVIESSLSEEIDGYLLLAKESDGWDAALSLILALDRDHRAFLERVLDRAAALASHYIDDLEALSELLSGSESLAEDVEAEREDRRAELGFVEPRAARGFLTLARTPLSASLASTERDALTKSYFRSLRAHPAKAAAPPGADAQELLHVIGELGGAEGPGLGSGASLEPAEVPREDSAIARALRLLSQRDPQAFGERMEELAYLANVLLAGAERRGARLEPAEAAEAALVTVAFGAELEARSDARRMASAEELCEVLRRVSADGLFRRASSALVGRNGAFGAAGYLLGTLELERVLAELSGSQPQ